MAFRSSSQWTRCCLLVWLMLLSWECRVTLADDSSSKELFERLDTDKSGQLDLAEFQAGADQLPTATVATGGGGGGKSENRRFWKAFSSAVAMIVATEIGDKTFFIAAVLSMKHDRFAVFGGAIVALIIMTLLSTAMGLVVPKLVDRRYTHLLGGALFLYFGVKLGMDGRKMAVGKTSEELEEVEEELLMQSSKKQDEDDIENAQVEQQRLKQKAWYQIAIQALSLTFVAEWGDRSQIATIALAASHDPIGVTIGGCLGHSFCTGLAVLGGRMLAARISERTVHLVGGALFLCFGIHSLFFEQ